MKQYKDGPSFGIQRFYLQQRVTLLTLSNPAK